MTNPSLKQTFAQMAAQRAVPVQQIKRPGGAEEIPGIDPFWFSALQPTIPTAPKSYRPRQWPFIPGFNKIWEPRGEDTARVPFDILFRASDEWNLWSCAMETVIDKILSLDWQIRPKGEAKDTPAQTADEDPIIDKLTAFFEHPCRVAGLDNFRGFGNRILTDMYVGDCATIWMEQNVLGQILSATPISGAFIKVLIDDTGRRPCEVVTDPDDPRCGQKAAAYQQVAYGLPAIDFTEDEIIYAVRKPRNHTAYGRSHLEQILTMANIGIRAQEFLLAYYAEGNTPEMLIPVDASTPAQKIEEWNQLIDSNLSGQLGERRKIKMIPAMTSDGKMQAIFPKEPLLKSEIDEWLARIVCFTLGLNPQAFVRSMNRATSEQAQDTAEAEGQQPVINWFEDVMNEIIRRFGYGDKYEFAFRVRREQDGLKQMQIDTGYLAKGVWTVNDVLRDLGMDTVDEPWADEHFIDTPTGAIPFPMVEEMTQANIDKIKQPPAPPKAPAVPSTPDETAEVVKKSISEVMTLVKAHHPAAKEAADKIEAKLNRKLAELHEKVKVKIKAEVK